MTFKCRICDDVFQSQEAATAHQENDHTRILPVGMRYGVRCLSDDCYLQDERLYGDLAPAEFLAWAHEQRWMDDLHPHVVNIRDILKSGGTATGQGGNAGDVASGGPRHA